MDSDSDQRMDSDSENEVEMDEAAGTNSPNQNIVVGKIVEVYLKNFLTHTEATVHPSEQLNLVSLTTSSSSSCSSPVRFSLQCQHNCTVHIDEFHNNMQRHEIE